MKMGATTGIEPASQGSEPRILPLEQAATRYDLSEGIDH